MQMQFYKHYIIIGFIFHDYVPLLCLLMTLTTKTQLYLPKIEL